MSQARILELLKQHPRGLTAKEIHEKIGSRNCYSQLKKLEMSGELITVPHVGHTLRWKLNE